MLAVGSIHIWRVSLDAPMDTDGPAWNVLSAVEQQRILHLRQPVHRARALVCRVALREVLGRYLGQSPAQVCFTIGEHGKPKVVSDEGWLCFNLSHSDQCALIAVAARDPLGVDVERVRPFSDLAELLGHVLAPSEQCALEGLSPEAQAQLFLRHWVHKEAVLKALGVGLGLAPTTLELAPESNGDLRLVRLESAEGNGGWHLRELALGTDFVGAVATRTVAPEVALFEWSGLG